MRSRNEVSSREKASPMTSQKDEMRPLTLETLVKQINTIAEERLPLEPVHTNIVAWANWHGWNAAETEGQRLLIKQALLNALISETFPALKAKLFPTPLDALGLAVPESLIGATQTAAQQLEGSPFNIWGELYAALIPQRYRRQAGQFWTNQLVSEWMVQWLLQSEPNYFADVGCGAGNFLLTAARKQLNEPRAPMVLYGCDVSPLVLNTALAAFQMQGENQPLPTLVAQDYLKEALPPQADAVICNPPYTRHHHIRPEVKDDLQALFKARFRVDVSRLGTLALYFLLKLISEMHDGARAAFIVPMEVLDAGYGKAAKRILCQHTTLSAIVHFSPRMNAFHKVDVGACILLLSKGRTQENLVRHLTLSTLPKTGELLACLNERVGRDLQFGSLVVQPQEELLKDSSKWFGISMPEVIRPEWKDSGLVVPLKTLGRVVRGIATGANQFFVLPTEQVKRLGLEPYVVRTIQRNREIQEVVLTESRWQKLADEGGRVWLLYLNGDAVDECPPLRAYLAQGETQGYHRRSLVQTRKRWFMMERRDVPPIFFTILTRGNPRFILNQAGVRPLNMFSLIYPNEHVLRAGATEALWALLNGQFSLSRLHSVSRTYGGNTLKVEPRELDNLPVVNPLALPDDAKEKIDEWVSAYHRHQQLSVLMDQINELVRTVLSEAGMSSRWSSLPRQMQLLDAGQPYQVKKDQFTASQD